ncbi:hypothetical protein [Catellatospora sichuanensis]|uniref:hypothetical protein n=1 Tax=Catellatospora sichuanensis TaxID=1969805 RepID=UPI0011820ACD|nr:hypothetical protein [Catellatospora sichuanensis]
MRSFVATRDTRLALWLRVREFAVPPSMIESATARRAAGDWAGACAAARVDVDLNLRAVAHAHGREFAARVRDDLRHLAPDLLRWHMPRIAPDGLLRPGLTVSLARYHLADTGGDAVHLVARTPPAWADAGQRISLALWDGSRSGDVPYLHPHPHPDRRFRLDLHRHLWDARRTGELAHRSGADRWPGVDRHSGVDLRSGVEQRPGAGRWSAAEHSADDRLPVGVPQESGCAVHRWEPEAALLLGAEGRPGGTVTVRLDSRHRFQVDVGSPDTGPPDPRITAVPSRDRARASLLLPDAATWVLPDLELLHHGLVDADDLHPLVAAALAPDRPPPVPRVPDGPGSPRFVECRGAWHRIALVDGKLTALDHDPVEIRREDLLTALGGPPLPCLRAIDETHRRPECLVDVRARLDHGDAVGALDAVEGLLGPDVLLRSGALLDELEAAVQGRITHGLFRAGLAGTGRGPAARDDGSRRTRRSVRSHPRHASGR